MNEQPILPQPQSPALVRARLDIAYDGGAFHGWATQPGLRTVQAEIEAALAKVMRLEAQPRLTVAGRTDAGVHARGQVAHVDVEAADWQALPGRSDRDPAQALEHRLNAVLDSDIVIRRVAAVSPRFDARFSALWRRYEYLIADSVRLRDPLTRNRVVWHRKALDAGLMNAAAAQLVGEHDFAAYCKPREGATTIRGLNEFAIERSAGGLIRAHLLADAFCHSMVRALIGAMVAVGEGRRSVDWPAQVLAHRTRDSAVQVAPAHGLSLEEVAYPETDAALAARSAIARRVRTLTPGPDHEAPRSGSGAE